MITNWLASVASLCILQTCFAGEYTGNGETREYWLNLGKADLEQARKSPNVAVAKNVILFVGDGMGVSTVTAARILKGQLAGNTGEESALSFENFPYVAMSKTYNQNAQTADSAGTATAMLCGVKTNIATLGVDASTIFGNCTSSLNKHLESMLDWVEVKGKSVGVVSNTRITHATPAALYAKTANRYWENDAKLAEYPDSEECKDIAAQLVDDNIDIKVILGGGRREFMSDGDMDPETGNGGRRTDGRNMPEEWMQKQAGLGRSYQYVWNATSFRAVNPVTTDYLFGLFNPSHMEFVQDRDEDIGGEPSLVEMVEKAVQILSKDPDGFFLLVEGGRIDHAHHGNLAQRSLYETIEFAEAVEMAGKLTDEEDTLTVVTADHSHVFTISGYPSRGHPILGLINNKASDGKPFTTLQYANGPGSWSTTGSTTRPDPSEEDTEDKNYMVQAGIPLNTETHAGEDVAIYAKGPMSHLVNGVHEQSYITHVMAYAACVGPYSDPEECAMADVEHDNDDEDSGSLGRFG